MFRAYAQLVRLPNVFTAWADVWLGLLIAQSALADGVHWQAGTLAFFTSTCFYWAGMVLNDFFDTAIDAQERPFRPIPSGRVSRRTAGILGFGFLLLGIGGTIVPTWVGSAAPLMLGLTLALLILAYDAWSKRTFLGPFNMGACRFVNLLLAIAIVGADVQWWMVGVAAIVGGYVASLTFLARHEAESPRIQKLIKFALMGIIVLDAGLAFVLVGAVGLLILILLPPALVLGKWIYST
jgi:4-hydroxybenzoate polyprenyltransferase